MADKQRTYQIKINGISESITQIDALISKIDSLSKKLDNLNKHGVKIDTTVTSGGDAGQAQQVAQVQKEITVEITKQNEELRQQSAFVDATKQASSDVLSIANQVLGTYGENIAKLDQINQAIKANKEAQAEVARSLKEEAIDAQTAAESRQRLLDEELRLKQARSEVQGILKNEVKITQSQEASYDRMSQTLGRLRDALRASGNGLSAEQFERVSQAIDKMDKELKEADKSVGNFQRNVGNYASAAEGFSKITITIAGVNKEFDSAKSAIMELKNAMAQLVMSGQQGTEAYKNLEEQMKNLQLAMVTVNDSIDRAKDASAGLHSAVEAIQGIVAIGSVGQGISSLFGMDDSALGEQIKKLTSLMTIMQGLQQLSTQMATGTGIGNALKKVLDVSGLNNNFAQLKENLKEIGYRLGMVKTQADTASAGMGNFSLAMKTAGNAAMALGKSLAAALAATGIIWAIGLVIDALRGLYTEIKNAISVTDDYERSNEALKASIDGINEAMQHQLTNIDNSVMAKQMSEADGYAAKMDVVKTRMTEIASVYSKVGSLVQKHSLFGEKAIQPALHDWSKLSQEIQKYQALLASGKDVRFDDTLSKGLSDIIKQWELVDKTSEKSLNNFATKIKEGANYQWVLTNAMKSTNSEIREAATQVNLLVNGLYDAASAGNALQNSLARSAANIRAQVAAYEKYGLKNMGAGASKDAAIAEIDAAQASGKLLDGEAAKARALQEKIYQNTISGNKKIASAAKKTSNDLLQFEKNLQADKLAVMRDGLTKTLAIIEQERRARLEAINKSGVSDAKKEEARVAANARYDKAVLDAQKEYHEKYLKEERDFEARVLRELSDDTNKSLQSVSNDLDKAMNDLKKRLSNGIKTVDLPNLIDSKPISDELKKEYNDIIGQMAGFNKKEAALDLKLRKQVEEYQSLVKSLSEGDSLDDESSKKIEEYLSSIRGIRAEMEELNKERMELIKNNKLYGGIDKAFSFDISQNREILSNFYREIASQRVEAITLYQEQNMQALYDKMKAERKEIANAAEDELNEYDKLWENRLKDQSFIDKEFGGDSEKAVRQYNEKRNEIINLYRLKDQAAYREYLNEKDKALIDSANETKKVYEDFYTNLSRMYTDANTSIMNRISGLPDIMKNAFGTFNLGDYKSKLKEATREMDALRDDVRLSLEGIREDWLNGFMDDETFYRLEREFSGMRDTIDENMSQVRDKLSSANGEWWKAIDEWIQNIASSFQQVLSAIFEYQNGEFDRMQEAIDKELDIVQKKYDEMEELAQKHKDTMNEIEDELDTARGDRRAHLIDALSAEIQAQREALAEQKKAEKEKERLQKKADKLELERKKQQRKQDIIQAILNTALAVSQAAANKWPIPAIPLMALAAAAGAAQVAIMSQTHYANGGLLEGKSHAQGGIKLSNGAEVEGNEFVTNKRTTMKNLDLMYYVNSKKRKLTLDDFVDFYGGNGKASKPIANYKFAEGGLLPNPDLAERLVNVVVERDTRPIYVSVVDINKAQGRLTQVRELAGQ